MGGLIGLDYTPALGLLGLRTETDPPSMQLFEDLQHIERGVLRASGENSNHGKT